MFCFDVGFGMFSTFFILSGSGLIPYFLIRWPINFTSVLHKFIFLLFNFRLTLFALFSNTFRICHDLSLCFFLCISIVYHLTKLPHLVNQQYILEVSFQTLLMLYWWRRAFRDLYSNQRVSKMWLIYYSAHREISGRTHLWHLKWWTLWHCLTLVTIPLVLASDILAFSVLDLDLSGLDKFVFCAFGTTTMLLMRSVGSVSFCVIPLFSSSAVFAFTSEGTGTRRGASSTGVQFLFSISLAFPMWPRPSNAIFYSFVVVFFS